MMIKTSCISPTQKHLVLFQVAGLKGQYHALEDATQKQEDDLKKMASALEDFTQNLRQVESDLEQVIDILCDQRPVSHDIDVIKDQQEEFKVII